MLLSQHYLSDGVARLRSIERQLRGNADIQMFKTRFYAIALEMIMASEEIRFTTFDQDYQELKEELLAVMTRVQDAETVVDFQAHLQLLLDNHFPLDRNYATMAINDFRRGAATAATAYIAANPLNMDMLSRVVETSRSINILDPKCKDGKNASEFRKSLGANTVYGIDMETHTAEKAKELIDRVAIGSLAGSRITNDAFDVMLIEAPISWNLLTTVTVSVKQEKRMLQDTIKYVRPDGIVVFLIPYYRMYKDMCVMISKLLKNVQIRRLCGTDFENKGLIAIVGQKSSSKEPDQDIYRMLRRLHTPNEFSTLIEEPLEKIELPPRTLAIETFRGSILDTDEMQRIVQGSGCYDSFWTSQSVEKLSENVKQPLLPFNIGQIGLVLTSGCLDGVVDEGDGHYHVIKGRVSKKSVTEDDILDPNSIEINETISNRVEINVMLSNGEYKILA